MIALDSALFDVGRLDRLAAQDTALHRLDPRAKIAATAAFLLCVVSYGKYEISALLPFALYPIALAGAGHIPFSFLAQKILIASPFAVLVGIFNPLLDRQPALWIGPLAVGGGWLSFVSILLRFALTVGAAMALIAVTSFDGLCHGMRQLGMPRALAIQLLCLYRYIFVLVEEALRLSRARALRSFGGRGLGMKTYGSLAGHLLLRTLDRAARIHLAMRCRGFSGEFHPARPARFGWRETLFVAGWCAAFGAMRFWNPATALGALATGLAP